MSGGQETYNKIIKISDIEKLIETLKSATGNGKTMISIILCPHSGISGIAKILEEEFETVSNNMSLVNQQAILATVTSAQQRLKLYNKAPPNGLVLYTGRVAAEDGKEKEVIIEFEPFKQINWFLYACDDKFYTEALNELVEGSNPDNDSMRIFCAYEGEQFCQE